MRTPPPTPPVILLMGPTATGKTQLAVELVRRLPCAIVSVDSAMVYRGMDVGTAKPGPDILRVAPHRLIDILDPAEAYSAGRFCTDAAREIADLRAHGRIPLLVGGTMLYFRALQHGLSALPAADPALRARLDAEAARLGWEALHRRLALLDPAAAARIHPNDPQRIQRALEVYELSGATLTELHTRAAAPTIGGSWIKLALVPADRSALHAAIEQRFHRMLERGLVEEVRRLRARGDLGPDRPALRAVGYRQVWEYLDDRYGYAEMARRGVIATRQLAKRQSTWLRAQPDARRFDAGDRQLLDNVLKVLTEQSVTG